MEIRGIERRTYQLIQESKIETACGGLYQGMDIHLQRNVAVKRINIDGDTKKDKYLNYAKALTEVQAMVRIGEENISVPQIFDAIYDDNDAVLYIVMEWIKGKSLSEHMMVPEKMLLSWIMDLCDILIVMEKKRIYHKDIKPDNIMIRDDGQLYLIDFNISISTPNLREGTLHYKAPEMERNSKYQGREKVDMFSIGVILYEYYTGKVPVRSEDYGRTRQLGPQEWNFFVEPKEKNEKISEEMNLLILKCMKLNPRERFRDYGELKYSIKKAMGSKTWNSKTS